MAKTAVTPTQLVLDTVSADLIGTGGVSAATTSDGWAIAAPVESPGSHDQAIIIRFWNDATAATVTVNSGDNPPAARAGLGDYTFALPANDVLYLVADPSRFRQDDGTMNCIASDDAVELAAMAIPRTLAV